MTDIDTYLGSFFAAHPYQLARDTSPPPFPGTITQRTILNLVAALTVLMMLMIPGEEWVKGDDDGGDE